MIDKRIIVPIVSPVLAGCASIVCPFAYNLSISSNAKNSKVTIYNRDEEAEVVTTPTEVLLSPKGGYFLPAEYRFVFEKEGFRGDEVKLKAKFNWWYVGNVVLGGLIGCLIVDPVTGAMWEMSETSVYGSLKPLNPQFEAGEPHQEIEAPSWIFQGGGKPAPKPQPEQDGQSFEIDQIPL